MTGPRATGPLEILREWNFGAGNAMLGRSATMEMNNVKYLVFAASFCVFCWVGAAHAGDIRGKDGKCVNVPNGDTTDGTYLDYRTCNGGAEQQWTMKDGAIVGKGGKCIDIPGGVTSDGTTLVLWTCESGAAEQKWSVANDAIVGKDGKCIDIPGGKTDDGAPVQIAGCDGSPEQKWKF